MSERVSSPIRQVDIFNILRRLCVDPNSAQSGYSKYNNGEDRNIPVSRSRSSMDFRNRPSTRKQPQLLVSRPSSVISLREATQNFHRNNSKCRPNPATPMSMHAAASRADPQHEPLDAVREGGRTGRLSRPRPNFRVMCLLLLVCLRSYFSPYLCLKCSFCPCHFFLPINNSSLPENVLSSCLLSILLL